MMSSGLDRQDWQAILAAVPATAVTTAKHGRLSFRQVGPIDAPPLVLLHGIGSGSGSFAFVFKALARQYRVIAWDAPGYGDSDALAKSDPTPADYAEALADLLNTLFLPKVLLLGHSLGALIGGAFAASHPERVSKLILACTAHGHTRLAAEDREAKLAARLDIFERLGPEAHAAERAHRLLGPEAGDNAKALGRYNMARLRGDGYKAAAHCLSVGDLLSDCAGITAPTLVIAGSADNVTPPAACRAVADAIGHGTTCIEIPGAGHACYVDRPDAFLRIVLDFLGEAK